MISSFTHGLIRFMLVNFQTREGARELSPHICRSDHLGEQQKCSLTSIQAQWLCKGVSQLGDGYGGAHSARQVTQYNALQYKVFMWHLVPSCAPATPRPCSLASFRPTLLLHHPQYLLQSSRSAHYVTNTTITI